MLDNSFKQSLSDLLNFYKSRIGFFIYERPGLDIMTKKSLLHSTAYQEVRLDTKQVTSLCSDMLLPLLRFSPST